MEGRAVMLTMVKSYMVLGGFDRSGLVSVGSFTRFFALPI